MNPENRINRSDSVNPSFEGVDEAERIFATYYIETPYEPEKAAAVLAGEQSSGTFVAVPGETEALKQRFAAKVEDVDFLETDVRWLSLSKPKTKSGLQIIADNLLSMSAWPYTEKNITEAKHTNWVHLKLSHFIRRLF